MDNSSTSGPKLHIATIKALVGALCLLTVQGSGRYKLFIEKSSPPAAFCDDSVTLFETDAAGVSACMVMCLTYKDCKEISYHSSDRKCKGFLQKSNTLPCPISGTAVSYITGTHYVYLGCYLDDPVRAMTKPHGSTNMSNDLCYAWCLTTQHDVYFGTQNSNGCFCGNVGTNYSMYGRRDETECWKPCVGNRSQICGAQYRNSVHLILQ